MGAHQRILIVKLGAGEEVEAGGVDKYRRTFGGDNQIILVAGIRQVEFILKAGAAAG